jgi:hypothetical protein
VAAWKGTSRGLSSIRGLLYASSEGYLSLELAVVVEVA